MVQGHDPPLLVDDQELVEGVAHIAVAGVHHVVIGIGDGHVALPHRHGQVGLVVQAVAAGVHLVAGADIQVPAVLVHAQGAGVKGHGGVGPPQAGLAQALPVLGVLHHPDHLGAVALRGVFLAEYKEVIVRPGEETAPAGQLHGDGAAGQVLEVGGVVLRHDLAAGILHPSEAAGFVLKEVGVDRPAPGGIVLVVDVAALRRPASRRQGRARQQGQGQRQGQKQGKRAFFHVWDPPYFLNGRVGFAKLRGLDWRRQYTSRRRP